MKSSLRAGTTVDLEADRLSLEDASASGEIEGTRVHALGLFPAERGEVRIDAVSRHHPRAFANLRRLLVRHPQRRKSPCEQHFDPLADQRLARCEGCPLIRLEVRAQREAKIQALREDFGLTVDRVIGPEDGEFGYRYSAKRVVSGKTGALVFGSYRRRSHDVADMASCRVDHPLLVACLEELRTAANRMEITAFDPQSGEGDLRYIWLKTNGEGTLLTLVSPSDASRERLQSLAQQLAKPTGVAWSVQASKGDGIRGGAPEPLSGVQELEIELAGVKAEVGPLGFLQPNPSVAAQAYTDLVGSSTDQSHRGKLAWDLYAGAGITTKLLKAHFETVTPCESFAESAADLGIEAQRVDTFLEDGLKKALRPELIIANPPRQGLGAKVCEQLAQLKPEHLQIMSCSPKSLARDLKALEASFELLGLRAYDTLPHTPHVELVAWLRCR